MTCSTFIYVAAAATALSGLCACGSHTGASARGCAERLGANAVVLMGDDGAWVGGSAEYPVSWEAQMGITLGPKVLPPPLVGTGYFTGGVNRSDDLYLFIKRRIEGLEPGAKYRALFCVTAATALQANGIGQHIYVTAGLTSIEPQRSVVVGASGSNADGYYVMNVDKGGAGQGGSNALSLGLLEKPLGTDAVYGLATLQSQQALTFFADDVGKAWFFVGADSTYEVWAEAYWVDAAYLLDRTD